MVGITPMPPAQPVVVTLPAEIDLTNADSVDVAIARACSRRGKVVVADMTATTFCDSVGVQTLVRAGRQARAKGCELRLLVPQPGVLRVLELLGIGTIVPIYHSLDEALADVA